MATCHADVPRPREEGVATVWAIAWIFVCLTIGWVGVVVAAVIAAQHRLDAAADLSVLSAAAELQRGRDACGAAADIARDNAAGIAHCRVDGDDVVVTVARTVSLPFGVRGRLTSTARAGP
jgi:secretion/DNA translocation related TadE-like protein